MKNPGIFWLDSPECMEYSLVGTEAGNLARLIDAGFSVPSGFYITTQALRNLGTQEKITGALKEDIFLAYRRLSEKTGRDVRVAGRQDLFNITLTLFSSIFLPFYLSLVLIMCSFVLFPIFLVFLFITYLNFPETNFFWQVFIVYKEYVNLLDKVFFRR